MSLTAEEQAAIRRLSEDELYHEAISLAREQSDILGDRQFGSQIDGLLQFSRSWDDLRSFVAHQRDREWTGGKACYAAFYGALDAALEGLYRKVKDEWGLVPQGMTRKETQQCQKELAGAAAHELVQHLYAELLYQQKEGS